MQPLQNYLGLLLLGATLVTPLGVQADATPKGVQPQKYKLVADDKDKDKDKVKEKHEVKRYYDTDRKDYHAWDEREAAAYRHWLMEERREHEFRDYDAVDPTWQGEYWRWRHEHPDWH